MYEDQSDEFVCGYWDLKVQRSFFLHSFILYLPYIQNFTIQGWNNEIKEKVNGGET